MKKIYFIVLSLMCALIINAQSIDFTKDGRHYYIASPNGKYHVGTIMDGPACFFDAEAKKHYMSDSINVSIMGVTNNGDAYGSYLGYASLWHLGQEWERMPGLDGTGDIRGEVCGISKDGNRFVLEAVVPGGERGRYAIIVYDKLEDGSWKTVEIPYPLKDDVYKMSPQFIRIGGINYDGNRILGEFLTADGKRVVPFVWEQDPDKIGDKTDGWNYRFLLSKTILKEGVNIEDMLPRSEFSNVLEYDEFRNNLESGILVSMPGFSVTTNCGNGKYIPCQVVIFNEEYEYFDSYAGAIDVEKDSLIILNAVNDAATISINDYDEAMVYSPGLERFRKSFVVDIAHPDKAKTLTEYTKERTNGKIDLSQYMMYRRDHDGKLVLAEGSATWATEGNGFVTFNYDEYNENLVPHCYMVRFDGEVDNAIVEKNELVDIYPNPAKGIINFSEELENITMYDLSGRKVLEKTELAGGIDLTSLSAGTYIMCAERDENIIKAKIVVTK